MKMKQRFATLMLLLVPGIALAHAGHLDTIEHAVMHMLEHNGKELGVVILVVLALLIGLYANSTRQQKSRSTPEDKK